MSRRNGRGAAPPEAAAPPTSSPDLAVHEVKPGNVYTVDAFQRIFRLRSSTLRREVREGRLRVSKRAGRYFVLGAWVLEWLEGGELTRRKEGGRE